jgi:hypothetical protein
MAPSGDCVHGFGVKSEQVGGSSPSGNGRRSAGRLCEGVGPRRPLTARERNAATPLQGNALLSLTQPAA